MENVIIRAMYTGFEDSPIGTMKQSRWFTSETDKLHPYFNKGSDALKSFPVKGENTPFYTKVLYELHGEWENTNRGIFFKTSRIIPAPPKNTAKVILISGLIPEVSRKQAEEMAEQFGDDLPAILDNNPELLLRIPGIKADIVLALWSKYKKAVYVDEMRSIYPDIPLKSLDNIWERLGEHATRKLLENPYLLAPENCVPFDTMDKLAVATNAGAVERSKGMLLYAFANLDTGDLWATKERLIAKTTNLGNKKIIRNIESNENLTAGYEELLKERQIVPVNVNGTIYVAPQKVCQMEFDAAAKLNLLCKSPIKYERNLYKSALNQSVAELGFQPANGQISAVRTAMASRVMILTGGPGTGKTTVLRLIVSTFHKTEPERDILVLAPTGRAAKRAQESTGEPAMTTDLLLTLVEGGEKNMLNALQHGLVVCDEMSMMGAEKFARLLSYLTPDSRLILVGDPDQLPSVEPGDCLYQLVSSKCINHVHLKEIFRQKNGSTIPKNAEKIRRGDHSLDYSGGSFVLIEAEEDEKIAELAEKAYLDAVRRDGLDSVALLTPRRRNLLVSTDVMNRKLQSVLREGKEEGPVIFSDGYSFYVGDRVMQTENVPGISNGECGTVVSIGKENHEWYADVLFDGHERPLRRKKPDFEKMTLGYAFTIHKSQGQEYRTVVIPLTKADYGLLNRNLLYTGVTRAKEKVILVGKKGRFHKTIRESSPVRRISMLGKFLETSK